MFVACAYFYQHLHYSWLWFAVLWLAWDLSMLGYALGSRIGAYAYNAVHSFVLPAILLMVGQVSHTGWITALALIEVAHITLDRTMGYGLKDVTDFTDTHLGKIGKAKK